MENDFDYRDYLPKKTNMSDSPKDWDIEYESSYINDGIEYFVVDLKNKVDLVLLQGRVVNGLVCVRDREGNIKNYSTSMLIPREIYNPIKIKRHSLTSVEGDKQELAP